MPIRKTCDTHLRSRCSFLRTLPHTGGGPPTSPRARAQTADPKEDPHQPSKPHMWHLQQTDRSAALKQQSQRGFVFHSSHGLKSNNRGSASASESFKVRHARERAHRLRTQKRIRISQASHTCGLRETNHSFVRAGVDVSRAYIRVHIMCTCVCLTPTILWHYCQ